MCINDAPTGLKALRLYNYSQRCYTAMEHPLADYKWYDVIMNCDIKLKGVHYQKR